MMIILNKSKIVAVLLLTILALALMPNNADAQYCTDVPSEGGLNPPKPGIPDVFYTKIELNRQEDPKKSIHMRAFFDYDRRMAAISIQTENVETKYIYDYDVNQIHVLKFKPEEQIDPPYGPIECNSIPLDSSPEQNFYFGFEYVSNKMMPKRGYQVLRFINDTMTFQGVELVRGIYTDTWISCQYLPELKLNYTIKYYFTKNEYSVPHLNDLYNRVPVKAVVNGIRDLGNGKTEKISNEYQFFDFIANRTYHSEMRTPEGVICKNRKSSRNLPINKPRRFRLSEESIRQSLGISYLKDFVYDMDYQLVRVEFRNNERDPETYYTYDPIKIVKDYNTAVSYGINLKLGNCTISPITNRSLEEDANFTNTLASQNIYVVRLKSAESLLLLDRNYTYTGKRETEAMRTDSFISTVTNPDNTQTVVEYQFTQSDFATGASSDLLTGVPTSFTLDQGDGSAPTYANIYNFQTHEIDPSVFDVSECFPDQEQLDVRLAFPYKDITTMENVMRKEMIEELMYAHIVNILKESYTRISRPKVSVSSNGNIYVRFKILPSPPPLTMFTLIPGKWVLGGSHTTHSPVPSVDICAGYCIEHDDCLGFDYGLESKICFLSTKHFSTGTPINVDDYLHYSRSTLNGFTARPTYKIYDILKREVDSSSLVIELKIVDSTGSEQMFKLIANEINLIRNNGQQFQQQSANGLSKFDVKFTNKKFAVDRDRKFSKSVTLDDCAKYCTEESMFECRSFDYCFITNECRLSKTAAADTAAEYTDDYCNVYNQNKLFHYRRFPGSFSVNKDDLKFTEVSSSEDCAAKCDAESSLHCRSFNFCRKEKICYLSDSHLLSASDSPVDDLSCSHFSRDYLADFTFTAASKQVLSAEILYTDNTLQECATACVIADGFSCKSFDFCAETKTCMLNSGPKKISSSTTEGLKYDNCNNYLKEYFYVTSDYKNTKASSDNSTGVLVGLSVAFTLLSLLAGVVGTHFLIKKKFISSVAK